MTEKSNHYMTHAEIAELTGLSAATISKVINGRQGVADKTRILVESIIEKNGMKVRRSGTVPSSGTIELVLSHVNSTSTIGLLRGATIHAQKLDIGISVTEVPFGVDRTERFRRILDRNPLGVILELEDITSQETSLFQSRDIPFVIINLTRGINDDLLCIGIDNWSGGFLAGQHLAELGHTNIGVITGPKRAISSAARLSGFRAALDEHRISPSSTTILEGDYEGVLATNHAEELLNMDNPPSAIFAFNDVAAIRVYSEAARRGIRIPQDLSIIGFDDIFPTSILGLTTVHQPFNQVAQQAMDMVVDARKEKDAGQPISEKRVILPTHLVPRSSTAPIR